MSYASFPRPIASIANPAYGPRIELANAAVPAIPIAFVPMFYIFFVN